MGGERLKENVEALEAGEGKEGGHVPIYINGAEMERVQSVNFLGTAMTNNLSWTFSINAIVKKAQQHLFFLWQLRKFGMSIRTLTNFYRCAIESIQSWCMTA
eukprot:g31189.t1